MYLIYGTYGLKQELVINSVTSRQEGEIEVFQALTPNPSIPSFCAHTHTHATCSAGLIEGVIVRTAVNPVALVTAKSARFPLTISAGLFISTGNQSNTPNALSMQGYNLNHRSFLHRKQHHCVLLENTIRRSSCQ